MISSERHDALFGFPCFSRSVRTCSPRLHSLHDAPPTSSPHLGRATTPSSSSPPPSALVAMLSHGQRVRWACASQSLCPPRRQTRGAKPSRGLARRCAFTAIRLWSATRRPPGWQPRRAITSWVLTTTRTSLLRAAQLGSRLCASTATRTPCCARKLRPLTRSQRPHPRLLPSAACWVTFRLFGRSLTPFSSQSAEVRVQSDSSACMPAKPAACWKSKLCRRCLCSHRSLTAHNPTCFRLAARRLRVRDQEHLAAYADYRRRAKVRRRVVSLAALWSPAHGC